MCAGLCAKGNKNEKQFGRDKDKRKVKGRRIRLGKSLETLESS